MSDNDGSNALGPDNTVVQLATAQRYQFKQVVVSFPPEDDLYRKDWVIYAALDEPYEFRVTIRGQHRRPVNQPISISSARREDISCTAFFAGHCIRYEGVITFSRFAPDAISLELNVQGVGEGGDFYIRNMILDAVSWIEAPPVNVPLIGAGSCELSAGIHHSVSFSSPGWRGGGTVNDKRTEISQNIMPSVNGQYRLNVPGDTSSVTLRVLDGYRPPVGIPPISTPIWGTPQGMLTVIHVSPANQSMRFLCRFTHLGQDFHYMGEAGIT